MTTILTVEDDDDLRDLVSFILEELGYVVTTAGNGLEALARVHERMPDLILLDIKMPVMSGAEFAAEYMGRYGKGARAPIVVMTAADHASRRSQEIGASDFLPKPFSPEDLVDVVRKNVPGPRPRPAAEA